MKRKDRKSAQKITEKSSEENEETVSEKSLSKSSKQEIAGSTKDVPKEMRPMEITSLVQEICSLPVTEGKSVEEEKMSPSDDNPENENSVQEVTDNSVPQPKSSKEQEEILPLVLDPHGKPLLNLQVMKKSDCGNRSCKADSSAANKSTCSEFKSRSVNLKSRWKTTAEFGLS